MTKRLHYQVLGVQPDKKDARGIWKMIVNENTIKLCACFVLMSSVGCSQNAGDPTKPSTVTTSTSTKIIFKVYRENGISGVSGEVLDCYDKAYKSAPSVKRQRQVQHCISIDWAGYQLDSWASAALKTNNIPFFHEDALNERVRAFLPLSGLTEKEVEDLTFAIDDLLKSEINEANEVDRNIGN